MALLDPACHIHPNIPLAQRHKDRCLIESRGSALGVALFARPFKELLVEDRRARHDHAFIHASDDASVPMELIQREAATAGSTLPSRFIELWDRSAFQFGPTDLVAARIGCQWSWLPGKRPTVRNGRRRLAGC